MYPLIILHTMHHHLYYVSTCCVHDVSTVYKHHHAHCWRMHTYVNIMNMIMMYATSASTSRWRLEVFIFIIYWGAIQTLWFVWLLKRTDTNFKPREALQYDSDWKTLRNEEAVVAESKLPFAFQSDSPMFMAAIFRWAMKYRPPWKTIVLNDTRMGLYALRNDGGWTRSPGIKIMNPREHSSMFKVRKTPFFSSSSRPFRYRWTFQFIHCRYFHARFLKDTDLRSNCQSDAHTSP